MVEQAPSKDQLYYLQVRGFAGNSLIWWRKGRCGYTADIQQAHVFTEAEAFAQQRCRPDEDSPWRKDYIDSILQHHVHCEKVDRDAEAAYSGHEPPADPIGFVARAKADGTIFRDFARAGEQWPISDGCEWMPVYAQPSQPPGDDVRDAARYRFIRNCLHIPCDLIVTSRKAVASVDAGVYSTEVLDAVIDKALTPTKGEGCRPLTKAEADELRDKYWPKDCSCNGTSLDHLCRVHGNHPSSIGREFEPSECDNTRGPSSQGEPDGQ